MDPIDAGNPYRAPEASIAALRAEIRRPPVYAAISLCCWVIAAMGFLLLAGCLRYLVTMAAATGWRHACFSGSGPRMMLVATLSLLGSIAYIAAARSLRTRRGRPGLILAGAAIGLSYLDFWVATWP